MERRGYASLSMLMVLILTMTGIVLAEDPAANTNTTTAVQDSPEKPSPSDISSKGACSQEIVDFCSTKKEGASELADCITSRIRQEKKGNVDDGKTVSGGCKTELHDFKVARAKNIEMDKKLADACVEELKTKCSTDDYGDDEGFGDPLSCLRAEKASLSARCKEEVFRTELDAAQDFQLDASLAEMCQQDAQKLCKDVQPEDGAVQACLRTKREKASYECQVELFRQMEEDADDIRLNVRLFRACLNDKLKFCKDVVPGDARVKDCLEDHRHEPEFSPSCKEEFEKMMEMRSKDFRLDANLKQFCRNDIRNICYNEESDMSDMFEKDAKVIQCLQDFRAELTEENCKREVHRLTVRAADEIQFDAELSIRCKADREGLCGDVEDVGGKVFRCLQEKRESLHSACRQTVFDQELRAAVSVDFKPLLKSACTDEITKLCKRVPAGEQAAVLKCLQSKVMDAAMGVQCRAEVRFDEIQSAQDWRLNLHLREACEKDSEALNCTAECETMNAKSKSIMCGGTVLKCLQEKIDMLLNTTCKDEVFFFEKQETGDVRLDVPLQRACKEDLEKFCPAITFDGSASPDHGRTLKCLRSRRKYLTEQCRNEEMHYSIMEASDIRLQPTLMNACAEELQTFCDELPPEDAFKCLQEKLEDYGMGAHCRAEVILQELRQRKNYRLDVRVRKECDADAARFCADVDKEGNQGHAAVLKCFTTSFKKLSPGCKTEVSYAVRMALWEYQRGSELTRACDGDVDNSCKDVKGQEAEEGVVLGVYGQCLLSQRMKRLSSNCRTLVRVASAVVSHSFEQTLSKIDELQGDTSEGFTISGWFAVVSTLSFLLVVVGAAYGAYIYSQPQHPYTLVIKGNQTPPTKFGDL